MTHPKGGFSKKDYFQLDIDGFGVSEKLKTHLLEYGLSETLFRPVYTKRHDTVLGYQLIPKTVLPEICEFNNIRALSTYPVCGTKCYENFGYIGDYSVDGDFDERAYSGLGYPTYISSEISDIINREKIVKTVEFSDVIISLDLYNFLIKL